MNNYSVKAPQSYKKKFFYETHFTRFGKKHNANVKILFSITYFRTISKFRKKTNCS